jgi:hypothetical protein
MHPNDLRDLVDRFIQSHKKRQLRRSEHELRRKTLRINDGSNQCLPPSAWMTIADRIAN